jgi:hypothetical protein
MRGLLMFGAVVAAVTWDNAYTRVQWAGAVAAAILRALLALGFH